MKRVTEIALQVLTGGAVLAGLILAGSVVARHYYACEIALAAAPVAALLAAGAAILAKRI